MAQTLKILFVVTNSMLNREMPTGLENLALRLHSERRKVTILAGGEKPFEDGLDSEDRCAYIWTGTSGTNPCAFLRTLSEMNEEEFPDVVIGWVSSIALIARKYSHRTLCIGHNGQMPPRSFLLRMMKAVVSGEINIRDASNSWFAFQKIRKNLHFFVGNSEAVRAAWVKKLRFPLGRSYAIKRGVDLSFYRPNGSARPGCLVPTLVFVGRPSKHKGFFELIEALRLIKAPIKLRVFGKVSEAERYSLERSLKGLTMDVSFRGILPSEALRREYWAADIFVLPSVSEGMPKALLEAMGCGLFVLCSDIPPHREVIQHGVNGFLHRTRSAYDLRIKLKEVLDQKQWTLEMERRALATVHQFHDIETEVNAWIGLLEEKFDVLAVER